MAGRREDTAWRTTREAPDPLAALCEQIPGFGDALASERQGFDSWACMPPSSYVDREVLDFGCGIGAASAVFVNRGARFVWGIDPTLTAEQMRILRALPRSRFTADVLAPKAFGEQRFDLVYARFVTEHVYDMPRALTAIYDLLRPGGRFVGLHDNYLGPMGAHELGLFGCAEGHSTHVVPKAVPCWNSPERCETSREFRAAYASGFNAASADWTLTPEDCERCPYFRRAQLWAHLRYQDVYPALYAGEFYRTWTDGGLNKVTPFQLRQYLIEAGFAVTTWEPIAVTAEEPPAELLRHFSAADLQTGPILFAGDRSAT
jgi:SAM-dependent methyltransferase